MKLASFLSSSFIGSHIHSFIPVLTYIQPMSNENGPQEPRISFPEFYWGSSDGSLNDGSFWGVDQELTIREPVPVAYTVDLTENLGVSV